MEESNMFPNEKSMDAEEQASGAISPADAQMPLADQPTGFIAPIQGVAQETMPGVPYGSQAPYGYPPTVAYPPQYAQPGYPPSMYQQPPSGSLPLQPGQPGLSAPARKRHTWMWVLLVIVVGFLLSGGVAIAIVANLGPSNTPTQTLQQYCNGYMTANAQEVY
ncbi:MAG TPA: hypothetical protein VGM01_09040, partial [Ktedonobacteraceae bacterium]